MRNLLRTLLAGAGLAAVFSAPAYATIYEGLFSGAPTGGNIPYADGTTPGQLDASSLSDNGSSVTGTEPINATLVVSVANAGTNGTTANALAKLNSSGNAVITATADTSGAIGVVVLGAGTSGNALIAKEGTVTCAFDGATTAGDYVQISSTTGGDCRDSGSTTYPTSGQVLGRALSTNGSAGSYSMLLGAGTVGASGGGGSPGGSSTDAQFNNGSGFGGSSGLTLTTTKVTGLTFSLGSDATGDIYYNSGSGVLARLGIGTTNQVLTVSGGAPSWATPSSGTSCPTGFSLSSTTGECYWTVTPATNSTNCVNGTAACIYWTGLALNEYRIACYGITAGSGNKPEFQFGEGSTPTYETASYHWTYAQTHSAGSTQSGSESDAGILQQGMATSGSAGWSGQFRAHGLQQIGYKTMIGQTVTYVSSTTYATNGAGQYQGDTNAITAIRLVDNQTTPTSLSGGYCTLYPSQE
jgi:hypothetical protein